VYTVHSDLKKSERVKTSYNEQRHWKFISLVASLIRRGQREKYRFDQLMWLHFVLLKVDIPNTSTGYIRRELEKYMMR
jgi:hypothetical protein